MKPGEYVRDPTEGITCVQNLPPPLLLRRSRDYRRRLCPRCGRSCFRHGLGHRTLHEVGCLPRDRPRRLLVVYSQHYCACCHSYFPADMTDLAPPGSHSTRRVIALAVRLVVEDGLPYRLASWHLWRDHRVFVRGGGGKKGDPTLKPIIWTGPWLTFPATWPPTNCTTAPFVSCRPSIRVGNGVCSTRFWITTRPKWTSCTFSLDSTT